MRNRSRHFLLSFLLLFSVSSHASVRCEDLLRTRVEQNNVAADFASTEKLKPLSAWLKNSLPAKFAQKIKSLKFAKVNNEAYGYKLLKNLKQGGTHIGVGGDFNYTTGGLNRSNQIIIYDVDPNVILFHQIMRSLILSNESPRELLSTLRKFSDQTLDKKKSEQLIREIPNDLSPETLQDFIRRSELIPYLTKTSELTDAEGHRYTYLGDENSYSHIQNLYKTDQIRFGLADQFENNFLKTLTVDFNLGKVTTLYISNTLDYIWLTAANEKNMTLSRKYMRDFSTLILPGVSHGNILKIFQNSDLAQSITENSESTKPADVSLDSLALIYADIRDASHPWSQFWRNVKKLPADSDMKVLSTNREEVLFGPIFDKYSIEASDEAQLHWRYAQLSKDDWNARPFLNAPNNYTSAVKKELDKMFLAQCKGALTCFAKKKLQFYGKLLIYSIGPKEIKRSN